MPSVQPTIDYDNPKAIHYMDTTRAYDLWSSVYDTDGNFLQGIDTLEMKTLLPQLFALDTMTTGAARADEPLKIVDLGCGTGRNTVVLTAALGREQRAEIVAMDASEKMMDVARQRLSDIGAGQSLIHIHTEIFDMIEIATPPQSSLDADAIISTLVIEHIPADIFFRHVSTMLRSGGILLLTNMHSEMGGISQAGFVDPNTGEKIRPKSYPHTVAEVLESANKFGLEPVGNIEERLVDEKLCQKLGPRSKKWIGITCWFGGFFVKRR